MSPPIAWTIAGSDSGGGAGLQADLHAFATWDVHGCSVVTSITAQNTQSVDSVEPVSTAMVQAQLDALASDLPPKAMKTGLLPSPDLVCLVADALARQDGFKVVDPVATSSTGATFMNDITRDAYCRSLFPLADLVTPNLPEAALFAGHPIESSADLLRAAERFLAWGAKSVLIKGGHGDDDRMTDMWTNGTETLWLSSERVESHAGHGTGCALSAAITANLALGRDLPDSLVIGKAWVRQGLRDYPDIGQGVRPVGLGSWPSAPEDLPSCWWTDTPPNPGRQFPSMSFPDFGLYPIVERAEWVERLVELGVEIVQLRAKDLRGAELEQEVARAIAAAEGTSTQLFINDHWEAAIRHGAFGVHLGQDDLDPVALQHLMEAGLRLGISTHSYKELAVAKACRPSYVALGTLFRTTSKVMDYEPLGLPLLREMRQMVEGPIVAIGGIHLDRADDVLSAGVEALAVISEVSESPDLPGTFQAWRQAFERR